MFFTPKWKKDARLLAKGARKFLNYKRDLLKPDRIDEIHSRRGDLLDAIKSGDLGRVREASNQLRTTCDNALPKTTQVGWFEENVDVMFVAIVIALGLRAYYLQPFKIPTGSMQPTLNGITGHELAKDKWPSLPVRMMEMVTRGRSYVKIVNDKDRTLDLRLDSGNNPVFLRDAQWMHFFSRSNLYFTDSAPMSLPAPGTPMRAAGLQKALVEAVRNGGVLKKGTVLAEGYIDTGDLVLVDKMSYHFRKPNRGEVFVFDTVGIRGISVKHGDQGEGTHYIKRLCGVPGDSLTIRHPEIYNHGRILQEFGIQRVARQQGPYGPPQGVGYIPAVVGKGGTAFITADSPPLELLSTKRVGLSEYAAFGDNTQNSFDSRYWGPVHEYNLVGPALFSLWPFTTGHWGVIR